MMDKLSILLKELEDLGIAITVDASKASKKIMEEYEKKYGLSSYSFYTQYTNNLVNNSIPTDDVADWGFNCKCFISSGGVLEPSQKDIYLSIMSMTEYLDDLKSYVSFKKEECAPLFLFRFTYYFMYFKLIVKQICS